MTSMTPLFVAVGVLVAYPIAAAALLRATEKTRAEFANIGRELLIDPGVDEDHKQLVSDMLDDVFDWRFMAVATFAFPVIVFNAIRGRGHSLTAAEKAFLCDDRVSRFFDLHMKAVSAAAPVWALLFRIVAIVTIAFAICFVGVSVLSQFWVDTVQNVTVRVSHSGWQHPVNDH